MDWKKALAIGCGGCGVLCLMAIVAFVVFAMHASRTPEDVMVRIEQPATVGVGQEMTMTVVVENHRSGKAFTVTDIDLDDTFLAGFDVLGQEPPSVQSLHVPIVNRKSFRFDSSVPAGGTERYAFRLRATTTGTFIGEVNVNEGSRSIATPVHAQVTPAGAMPDLSKPAVPTEGAAPAPTGP